MRRKTSDRLKFVFAIAVAILLSNCSQKQTGIASPQKITVVTIQKETMPLYAEFVGLVYGYKDIPIRARVDGFLEGIHFQEGSPVKKGQLLYTIDSQPFEAEVAGKQSELAAAKTALVKAESDLHRYEPLAKTNAVSQSDYDATVANYEAAISSVEAAEAVLRISKINLGYTKILSPINGLIGKTMVKEGEYVGKSLNSVILNTVSNVEQIHVEFFLAENQYLRLARLLSASPEQRRDEDFLELILADGSLHEYKGKINFIDREVDPNTGAILVQASFPNPQSIIRPGQYAKVKIQLNDADGYLAVPQRCVKELQGQYSVFVVKEDNTIETRQISVSKRVADYWIVESGLEAKEKVVIDALQKVRNGVEIIPEVIEFQSKSSTINN